ncbi:MAG: N-acetylmuramoyl-L-alanine amidase [Defluviitaleaceae bacterium]|nr:N-acetylmuramoyl-L-alanine amidase [Defluviitaleaceae bacterium]
MNIQQKLLTPNKYSRPGTPLKAVKGVVVHYVGNPNTSAEANRNYFDGLKAGKMSGGNYIFASSQYIIGLAGEIVQCVPEAEVAYCSNNRNSDTISIECCHPLPDGKFTEATYDSLVGLTADICARYKLNPLTDVIRHYDVTGKACPLYQVTHPEAWEGFKKDVQAAMTAPADASAPAAAKLPEASTVNLRYGVTTAEIKADNVEGRYIAKVSELARVMGDAKVPVRAVAEAAGMKVDWDEAARTITISGGPCGQNGKPIAGDEYDILCRIAQAEAGNQDMVGRELIVNVILNRVKNPAFPKTIREVVFQQGQFSPVSDGAYYKVVVAAETRAAVDAVLGGADESQGALYFRTIKGATPDCWHETHLTRLFDHGDHRFYM